MAFGRRKNKPNLSRIEYCVMRIAKQQRAEIRKQKKKMQNKANPSTEFILSEVELAQNRFLREYMPMKRLLPLYMTGCQRYDNRQICRCSSMVERSFRKAEVVGPTPTIGCGFCYEAQSSNSEINHGQTHLSKIYRITAYYSWVRKIQVLH